MNLPWRPFLDCPSLLQLLSHRWASYLPVHLCLHSQHVPKIEKLKLAIKKFNKLRNLKTISFFFFFFNFPPSYTSIYRSSLTKGVQRAPRCSLDNASSITNISGTRSYGTWLTSGAFATTSHGECQLLHVRCIFLKIIVARGGVRPQLMVHHDQAVAGEHVFRIARLDVIVRHQLRLVVVRFAHSEEIGYFRDLAGLILMMIVDQIPVSISCILFIKINDDN